MAEKAKDIEAQGDAPTENTPLLQTPDKYASNQEYNWYDRLFCKDVNREFGDNAELAVRGAVAVTLSALPFVFPDFFPGVLDSAMEIGVVSPFVIMMLVFTLYKTVGETIYYAWCGIFGTVMASLVIWIMFGLYPKGYTGESTTPAIFGLTVGFLFYFVLLFLNFDMNTRIFALSNFCWFLMAFLDPMQAGFNKGFDLKLGGTAFNGLATAILGTSFAILASLLPYPLFALTKAKETARELINNLFNVWISAEKCFVADEFDEVLVDELVSTLKEIGGKMGRLQAMTDASWWECIGFSKAQQVRKALRHIYLMLEINNDRIQSVLHAVECEPKEEGKKLRQKIVKDVGPHLSALLQESRDCLLKTVDAALNYGWLTSNDKRVEDAKHIQEAVDKAKATTQRLTSEFYKTKKSLNLPRISAETLDENSFLYNACAFGRATTGFAEDLLQDIRGEVPLPHIPRPRGLKAAFDKDTIFSDDSLSFCTRQLASQLLLFGLGYIGMRGGAIQPYNAALASNAAVLMSQSVGPEMKKNLSRLQGIVLGTVVGHLVFAIFGGCELWSLVLICVCTLGWTWMCLFMYYDSVNYSGVGVLMAVFGPLAFLQPCVAHQHIVEDKSSMIKHWQQVIDIVFAVIVISIVDFMLAQSRASLLAGKALTTSWKHEILVLKDLFNPRQPDLTYHRAASLSLISRAESLGRQAAEEPRWWRPPFDKDAFDAALQCIREMRTIICGMEFSIAQKTSSLARKEGGAKKEVMLKLMQEPKFQEFISILLDRMARFVVHIEIFENDKTVQEAKLFRTSTKVLKGSLDAAMHSLIAEVNKPGAIFSHEAADSIEHGAAAQVSLVIDSVELLADKLMVLQRQFEEQ